MFHINTPTTSRRRAVTALVPLAATASLLALAGPASALPSNGGGGSGEPHNLPPQARFTITPNPALANSRPVVVATSKANHALPPKGTLPPIFGNDGDLVTFDGSASSDDSGITDYAWDLDGNGTYETHGALAKVEKKRFFAKGTFTIHLKVTDDDGASNVVAHTLTVRNAPHAALAADLPVPLVGQPVKYSAAGSTGDPGIARYDWDLDGDGTFETSTGTTPQATASYQSAGPRTVAVKVTDTLGTTAVATVTETVNQAPIAAFTSTPSPVLAGRTVTFDGSGSSDDTAIADYAWDLDGNGSFETDTKAVPTAKMTYMTPGTVNVGLRVTDAHGVTSTVVHPVVVAPNPSPTGGSGATDPAGDTVAPRMAIVTRHAKVSRHGLVTIRVRCPQGETSCSGHLALRSLRGAHGARLGGAPFELDGGQSAKVRVRLSAANRRLVARLHSLRTQATATATDAAGNTGTAQATVTLRG